MTPPAPTPRSPRRTATRSAASNALGAMLGAQFLFGKAQERFDIEYQHDEMSVGFNARYIPDFLSVLTTDDVTIQLQDPLGPALFALKNDTRHTCVIMPLRI